jgi:hypothetical protein
MSDWTWLSKRQVLNNGNFIDLKTKRQYKIKDEDLEDFWGGYCGEQASKRNYLAEIPGERSVVVGSIHLFYTRDIDEEDEDGLPKTFIRDAIYAFQQVLLEKVDKVDERQMLCAVLTGSSKSNPKRDFFLRLQFPLISVEVEKQKKVLIPAWEKRITTANLQAPISEEVFIETKYPGDHWPLYGSVIPGIDISLKLYRFYHQVPEDHYDSNDPADVYFSDVFRPKKDSDLVIKELFNRALFKEDGEMVSQTETSASSTQTSRRSGDEISEKWLPFFLSINFPNKIKQFKRQKVEEKPSEKSTQATDTEHDKVETLEEIRELCQMLPWEVRSDPAYKSKIGRICWYHSHGDWATGYSLWREIVEKKDFSKIQSDDLEENISENGSVVSEFSDVSEMEKKPVFDEDDVGEETAESMVNGFNEEEEEEFIQKNQMNTEQKIWEGFRSSHNMHYTLVSLHYLVKEIHKKMKKDKITEEKELKSYNEWLLQNKIFQPLWDSLEHNLLPGYVAQSFYENYSHKFIWTGKNWWYFDDHRWRRDKAGVMVQKYLGGLYVKRLEEQKNRLTEMNDSAKHPFESSIDQVERLKQKTIIDKIDGLCSKLRGDPTFKNKVRDELKSKFDWQGSNFEDIRDENPSLLVFNNCVVEFLEENHVVRMGLPEDFCTYSCKIRYLGKINRYKKREIRIYFRQVYPDRTLCAWMWRYWVSGLRGGQPDKNFVVHLGGGDNSKSGVIKLLFGAFGDYAIKGKKEELLANVKKSASGPEPEKVRKRGRRWVVYQELDGKDPWNGGLMRDVSGGDSSGGARDNFVGADDMIETKQMAKHSAMLNKLPPISEGGSVAALWKRRLKVVNYEGTWSDAAPTDVKEQWEKKIFPMDEDFESRLPEWYETFMSMLISMWKDYYTAKPRLPHCQKISDAVAQWQNRIDFYANFVNERVQFFKKDDGDKPDPDKKISVAQLYGDFRIWYNSFYGKNTPTRAAFIEEMKTKGLAHEGTNYIGVGFQKSAEFVRVARGGKNDESRSTSASSSRISKEDYDDDDE